MFLLIHLSELDRLLVYLNEGLCYTQMVLSLLNQFKFVKARVSRCILQLTGLLVQLNHLNEKLFCYFHQRLCR